MRDDAHDNAREVPVEIEVSSLVIDEEEHAALALMLSPAERARAESFVFEWDRRRFVAARARLRQLVAARIGTCPESVQFRAASRGKPSIVRTASAPDLRFNLSHCDDLAAYAFTIGREVGIDIERVRTLRDADAIAVRFFSAAENAAYQALEPEARPVGFFNCWTRKEAFIKAVGEGFALPLDTFDVSLAPGEEPRIIRVGEASGDECGWRLSSFLPGPGFVGAVVVHSGPSRNEPVGHIAP